MNLAVYFQDYLPHDFVELPSYKIHDLTSPLLFPNIIFSILYSISKIYNIPFPLTVYQISKGSYSQNYKYVLINDF
jgi:hypothetical protein